MKTMEYEEIMGLHTALKKGLDPEDQVQKEYRAKYNGKDGFLVVSNRKLFFTEKRGFLRTSYNLILELPYEEISDITVEAASKLALTDTEGKKHDFESHENAASVIERNLNDLIRTALPKIKAQLR